ncbi:MAG: crossover junction endodeoxyribonuclease RuvC [Clostridia bacterium]|nr:crossover junction endodeoxyribonuclease RuvC [Clostridia bacterium]
MNDKKQTVLGIDPGYAITGYGIITYSNRALHYLVSGVIRTQSSDYFSDRLLKISNRLDELIATFKPDVVAVEELFFSRNTKTGIGTAQARGVAVVSGARAGLPVFEYTPKQVKLAVTGYGGADKQQVQQMVRILLNLQTLPRPDDAADALAIAICHAHSGNKESALAKGGYP